tara:strand:+ start:274 stop:501 length:228 start_codon:yes stop_codon:yes gene_type:complete
MDASTEKPLTEIEKLEADRARIDGEVKEYQKELVCLFGFGVIEGVYYILVVSCILRSGSSDRQLSCPSTVSHHVN